MREVGVDADARAEPRVHDTAIVDPAAERLKRYY